MTRQLDVAMTRARTEQATRRRDVINALDVLRQNIARADAMVCAAERELERFIWGDEDDDGNEDGGDGRRREHLLHLVRATKEAVQAAEYAGGQVAAELTKHRKGT